MQIDHMKLRDMCHKQASGDVSFMCEDDKVRQVTGGKLTDSQVSNIQAGMIQVAESVAFRVADDLGCLRLAKLADDKRVEILADAAEKRHRDWCKRTGNAF